MTPSVDNPLIIGDDKKLLIKITKGQGPPRPPLGPDGRGRPRYVQVEQAGQVIEGVCYVGKKAENGIRLQIVVTGQSMRTMYIGAHPAIMESNTILKKRITLFPPPEPVGGANPGSRDSIDPFDPRTTLSSTSAKGKGKASSNPLTTIPLESEYPFSFEFPRFCVDVDADGKVVGDGSDDEDQSHLATAPTFLPDVKKKSSFVRNFSSGLTGEGSESATTRRPSLIPFRTGSATAALSSSLPPTSPSSLTNPPSYLSRTTTSDSIGSSETKPSGSITIPGNGTPVPPTARTRRSSSNFSFSAGTSFAAMGGLLGRSPSSQGVQTTGLLQPGGGMLVNNCSSTTSDYRRSTGMDEGRWGTGASSMTMPSSASGSPRDNGRRPSLALSNESGHTVGPSGDENRHGAKRKQKYHLPPSCNMLIGAVQTEIHYEIKFKLKRKGWRLNDTWIVRCMHFPKVRIPYERIPFQPRHPGWQTVRLPGGNPKDASERDKGKRRASDVALPTASGIQADIFVPSPLTLMIPRAALQESAPTPSIPFRLHFSSNLPFPLLTFASTEASQWRISLIRETRLVLHAKEEIRYSVLRGTWSLARDPLSAFAVGSPHQVENIDLTRVHTGSLGLASFREDDEAPAYDGPAAGTPPGLGSSELRRSDTRDTTGSSEEVHVFGQDLELEESSEDVGPHTQTGDSTRRQVDTSSSAEENSGPAAGPVAAHTASGRRLAMDDIFFTDDDPDEPLAGRELPTPRADSPPPGFDQTQYAPSLATMPPPPPPPPPAFRPYPSESHGDEVPQMDTEEHIYLDGTLTLFRSAYKAIYQPFETREVKIRYWLEITVDPKPGAVAEAFSGINGRVEAFVVRQGRTE